MGTGSFFPGWKARSSLANTSPSHTIRSAADLLAASPLDQQNRRHVATKPSSLPASHSLPFFTAGKSVASVLEVAVGCVLSLCQHCLCDGGGGVCVGAVRIAAVWGLPVTVTVGGSLASALGVCEWSPWLRCVYSVSVCGCIPVCLLWVFGIAWVSACATLHAWRHVVPGEPWVARSTGPNTDRQS